MSDDTSAATVTRSAQHPDLAAAGRWWRGKLAEWRAPLTIFAVARVAMFILAFLAVSLYPRNTAVLVPNPDYAMPQLPFWADRLLGVWGNWDGAWYLKIADQGYLSSPVTLAFFPLYPLLTRFLAGVLSGNFLFAALLISNGTTMLAWVLLHALVGRDEDAGVARRAVFYMAVFPTAYYFYGVYTEGLFLALAIGAFLAARAERWWVAAALATLATLTRSLGVFLVLPLAWEWWRSVRGLGTAGNASARGLRVFIRPSVAALALPVLAFGAWQYYAGTLYDVAGAVLKVQAEWSRAYDWPWNTIRQAFQVVLSPGSGGLPVLNIKWQEPNNLFDFLFMLYGLGMLAWTGWLAWRRRMRFGYVLFLAAGVMLPLLAPNPAAPIGSYPRYVLVLFPMFIAMARLGRRQRWFEYGYVYVALALQSVLFMRFANWYWVA